MIRPPGRSGVAFTSAADGDMRHDAGARSRASRALGIPKDWATVKQVHGSHVIEATEPGQQGNGDGLWTRRSDLPLAVFTADCFGVVIHADGAVGVAHAGWRGVASGVVGAMTAAMQAAGHEPRRAEVGPGIGPCCFEVGGEVGEIFVEDGAKTTWGTPSVDLVSALSAQLGQIDVWLAGRCTMHEGDWFSHRENQARERLAAIGWI